MDIHAEKGMQCADCHFAQDSHGNGLIYGEVANAVEIGCKDCHGTADAYPTLRPPARRRRRKGNDLSLLRNPDGQRRFEWTTDEHGPQRADPALDRRSRSSNGEVSLVKDSVDPRQPALQRQGRARQADVASSARRTASFAFGPGVAPERPRAQATTRWRASPATSPGPPAAAAATCRSRPTGRPTTHNYEGEETRNFATYNPQVARDDMFQLGRAPDHQGQRDRAGALVPRRWCCRSTNVNRERIYVQQPPISCDRLLQPGLRAALPAHRAHDRDQDLLGLPPVGEGRQQRDHGAAAAARHQLRQLRRAERLDRARRRVRGGARDRVGRAAGGDRLLPAQLRLSRLLPACTSSRTAAS